MRAAFGRPFRFVRHTLGTRFVIQVRVFESGDERRPRMSVQVTAIMIGVKDLARSKAFYGEGLGCTIAHPNPSP